MRGLFTTLHRRDVTMAEPRCYNGDDTMPRWRCYDVKMAMSRCHEGDDTMFTSCLRHRNIVPSPLYHRAIAIVTSWHVPSPSCHHAHTTQFHDVTMTMIDVTMAMARCYDGDATILRWRCLDVTMVMIRCHDGDGAMQRCYDGDGTMLEWRWHDVRMAMVRCYDGEDTMRTSCHRHRHFLTSWHLHRHRAIVTSPSWHRAIAIVLSPSWHCNIAIVTS